MSEWKTIDSAPNGETVVMGYFGSDKNFSGFAAICHFFKWERMSERSAACWPFKEMKPTHWMPLPPPPEG